MNGLKGIISYIIFFVVSFLVIFTVLYLITRGLQSPFAANEPGTDSTAVVQDSTWQATAGDSLQTDSLTILKKDNHKKDNPKKDNHNNSKFGKKDNDSLKKLRFDLGQIQDKSSRQAIEILSLRQKLENFEKKQKTSGTTSVQLKNLAKVYEAMPPEDAAKIINNLDTPIIIGLFKLLKQRQAAKILATLPPERAAKICNEIGKAN